MADMLQKCQHFFISFSYISWTAFHFFCIINKKVCFFSYQFCFCTTQCCLNSIFQVYWILKFFFGNVFSFFLCNNRTISKTNPIQIIFSQFFNYILHFLRLIQNSKCPYRLVLLCKILIYSPVKLFLKFLLCDISLQQQKHFLRFFHQNIKNTHSRILFLHFFPLTT